VLTLNSRKEELLRDLERAKQTGVFVRFFLGLNIDELKNSIARCEMDIASRSGAITSAEQKYQDLARKVHEAENQLRLARGETSAELTLRECNALLATKQQQVESKTGRLREIAQQLEELRARVVANCRVLGTTAYQSYLKKEIARPFDVVIVDEASMLSLPLVFYAAGLATKHVIVGGDFRQIPPIVQNDRDPVCLEWLKQDVFYKAGIVDAIGSGTIPANLAILTEQYRMARPICDFVSSLFYEGRLRTAPDVEVPFGDILPFEDRTNHLLYVDTSKWKPWAAKPSGSSSRYNPFHALLIRNLVQNQQQRGFLTEAGNCDHRVGIVSPYAAQSRLLTSVLQEDLQRSPGPLASTAHRFQGNEREVIICDIADSDDCNPSRFICATSISEDGSRLLNVALSRGKSTVVLVANFKYVSRRVPRDTTLRRVVEYFREHGEALNVDGMIPVDAPGGAPNKIQETAPAAPDRLQVFSQTTFYDAFIQDCSQAHESLVVYSPFITRDGIARWVPIWRDLIARGGRVRVVTRPSRPPNGQIGDASIALALIRTMRGEGVAVDLRRSMHEKIAFVDSTLVWHGSLNILSHRNTSESMLRVNSPAFIEQIGRNLATRKSDNHDLTNQENPTCHPCNEVTVLEENGLFRCGNCNRECDSRAFVAPDDGNDGADDDATPAPGRWINERNWIGKAIYETQHGPKGVAILERCQDGARRKLRLAFYFSTGHGPAVPPRSSQGFTVSEDSRKLSEVQFFRR
jgi:hypothetical protein